MILTISNTPSQFQTHQLDALEQREWRYRGESNQRPTITSQEGVKVEFRKILYILPFLFLSGVFSGIGIMLALT